MTRSKWWGNRFHIIYTVSVFILLASLDDTARNLIPPLYAVVTNRFAVSDAAAALVTSQTLLVIAFSGIVWGILGDRYSRKWVLITGTLFWCSGLLLTGTARTYNQLLLYQFITALGLGSIASIGYSVIVDLIPQNKRGLMLGIWGRFQGGAAGIGATVAALLVVRAWNVPFVVVGSIGLIIAVFFIFSFEPRRGNSEFKNTKSGRQGYPNNRRIEFHELPNLVTKKSNILIFLYSFLSGVVFGSLIWLPRLIISRLQIAGYSVESATISGNVVVNLFLLGYLFMIFWGYLGDRLQRRKLSARAGISMWTTFAAIPFLVTLFLLPINDIKITDNDSLLSSMISSVGLVFTNRSITVALIIGLVGTALASAPNPQQWALISDVNLPEHRGTVAGINLFSAWIGLALGNALVGIIASFLAEVFPPPDNYAFGLVLLQLVFIPAGIVCLMATKYTPIDIQLVNTTLSERV